MSTQIQDPGMYHLQQFGLLFLLIACLFAFAAYTIRLRNPPPDTVQSSSRGYIIGGVIIAAMLIFGGAAGAYGIAGLAIGAAIMWLVKQCGW